MHCKYRVGRRGIPELYEVFPDSHFNLIEPLQAFEGDLKRILRRYQRDYVLAAGLVVGGVTFNAHSHQLDGSSLCKESMGSIADGDEVVVPQIRIDNVVKGHGRSGPDLIKIDVQGAELDGATEILDDTEVIVLEVS